MKPNRKHPDLAEEAKAIVALAFRNGPIEDIHAGKTCPMCNGDSKYSHITDQEMKQIMKKAVDRVFRLLSLKEADPEGYAAQIRFGNSYTVKWDEPAETEEMSEYAAKLSSMRGQAHSSAEPTHPAP